jgi:ubiquitin-protein ligase
MKEHLPPGISIVKDDNLEEWQMDINVLDDNPLYKDQTYRLKFTFGSKYPIGEPGLLPHDPAHASTWLMIPQNHQKSNLSNSLIHPIPHDPFPCTPTFIATA